MLTPESLCRCGHVHDAHSHLRRGTDCAICGAQECAAYRAAGRHPLLQAVRASWLGRLVSRSRHDPVIARHPTAKRLDAVAGDNPPTRSKHRDEDKDGLAREA